MIGNAIPRMLAVRQVAEALGVSIFSIRRYINAGALRSTRIGRRVMVAEAEVLRAQQFGLAEIRKDRARAS